MDSSRTSTFILWLIRLAQTTKKPSGWLHGGGMKEHLRWTLWPTSSGEMVGRDRRGGMAAGRRSEAQSMIRSSKVLLFTKSPKSFLELLLVSPNVCANISPLHRPLTSTSPGGQSFGPTSGATETRDEYTSRSDAATIRCRFEDNIKCFMLFVAVKYSQERSNWS